MIDDRDKLSEKNVKKLLKTRYDQTMMLSSTSPECPILNVCYTYWLLFVT